VTLSCIRFSGGGFSRILWHKHVKKDHTSTPRTKSTGLSEETPSRARFGDWQRRQNQHEAGYCHGTC
jgi:hypothetical protein